MNLHLPPLAFDPARAARTLADLAERGFTPETAQLPLLEGVFGNSPYLARLALREPEALAAILRDGPEAVVADALQLALSVASLADEAAAMAALRRAKRCAALAIALADISGDWPLQMVTDSLTRFADAAVQGALRFLLAQAAARARRKRNAGRRGAGGRHRAGGAGDGQVRRP